jgi:hypothetical protein
MGVSQNKYQAGEDNTANENFEANSKTFLQKANHECDKLRNRERQNVFEEKS